MPSYTHHQTMYIQTHALFLPFGVEVTPSLCHFVFDLLQSHLFKDFSFCDVTFFPGSINLSVHQLILISITIHILEAEQQTEGQFMVEIKIVNSGVRLFWLKLWLQHSLSETHYFVLLPSSIKCGLQQYLPPRDFVRFVNKIRECIQKSTSHTVITK